ncbi:hypothetical protein ACE1ET_20535 [Saccharicrinis sp. FJH62]|uniref:hypothetical protein n=1 Tax=Saccharicrinis sp. FJH62 TaxID=3344657 RepID=UPI0035D42FA4
MTHILDFIKSLFFDNSKSWGFRTAMSISIIVFLLLIDFGLKFTYNIHINNKLEQLIKIQELKDSYSNDTLKLIKIITLENRILNSKHYSEYLSDFLHKIFFKSETIDQNSIQKAPTTIKNAKPVRNIYWMIITSSFTYIILFPFILFLPLYNKESRKASGIFSWISSLVMFVFFIVLITWLSYRIPLILGKPFLNYILNFIIHIIFLITLVLLSSENQKRKTNANTRS